MEGAEGESERSRRKFKSRASIESQWTNASSKVAIVSLAPHYDAAVRSEISFPALEGVSSALPNDAGLGGEAKNE